MRIDRSLSLALLVATALLSFGCAPSKLAPISSEELHGVWTLNDAEPGNIEKLRRFPLDKISKEENTIEIYEDGTCFFNTYRYFHKYGHLTSRGTWELKKGFDDGLGAETWYVKFTLTPSGSAVVVVGTRFYLKRRNDRLIMYDFIDDPDLNQFVEFVRKD